MIAPCNLQDVDLQGAIICGANLKEADLRKANLQDVDLQGAILCEASLKKANLKDADLCGAILQDANLREAILQGANLEGAKGILSFTLGQHLGFAYIYNKVCWMQIGCEHYSVTEWLEKYKEIGERNKYKEEPIKIYGIQIKAIAEMAKILDNKEGK
jgi:hypothetical protein